MKHFYCIALFSLLLVGCPPTETTTTPKQGKSETVIEAPEKAGKGDSHDMITPKPTTDAVEPETVVPEREKVSPEETETPTVETPTAEQEKWIPLFDGESTAGWSIPVYGGDGNVDVQEGNLVIGRGEMMTGIRYEKEFPKMNYEIRYEARRTQGYDFFAACTFPVKESFLTFVNGGWGGGLTGLSSIDGSDASENSFSTHHDYREKAWYRFRICVLDDKIQVWITDQDEEGNWKEEESVIELETEDRGLSTRIEMERYKPLAFCTWNAEGQLRKIEYRMIER